MNTKLFTISILLTLITGACKKENQHHNNNGRLITSGITKINNPGAEGLVSIFNWDEQQVTFFYYGTENALGEIVKINSVAFFRNAQKDTVYHFMLDNQNRVTSYFRSIKGNNDTTVIKYFYTPAQTILNIYGVNWQTKKMQLRSQVTIANADLHLVNAATYRMNGVEKDMIRLATDAAVISGGYILIAGAVAPTIPVVVGAAGTLVGAYAVITGLQDLYHFSKEKLDMLTRLLDLAIANAGAAEMDGLPVNIQIPDYKYNEVTVIDNYALFIISPAERSVFKYPRMTTVTWNELPGTSAYLFEAQFAGAPYDYSAKDFFSRISEQVKVNSFIFYGVGAQVHRFRVSALKGTAVIAQTPWRYINYSN